MRPKTSEITVKLKGHKNQYYVLKAFNSDGTIKAVHTSKDLNYLRKLRKERYSKWNKKP